MYLKMKEAHEGCKAGDCVRFENKAEALALVEAGKGIEVRPIPEDEGGGWAEVRRITAEVTDGVKTGDKA